MRRFCSLILCVLVCTAVAPEVGRAREIESVEYLLTEYRSGDERKREQMARKLRRRKEPASLPALAEVCRDASAKVRQQAVLELLHRCNRGGDIGKIGRNALRSALVDPDERVYGPIVRSFACLAYPAAVARDAVQPFLDHASSVVRADAARVLGDVPGPESVALLMSRLDAESDEITRAQVVRSLAQHQEAAAEAVPALLGLLEHPSAQLRRAALGALPAIAPGDPRVESALIEAAGGSDPLAQRIAARVLRDYPSPETLRALGALAAGDQRARKEARASIDHIVQTGEADDRSPAILATVVETGTNAQRRRALRQLRDLGPGAASAMPVLYQAIEDDDPLVRRAAYEVLLPLETQGEARRALLHRGFRDEYEGVQRLVAAEFAALGDEEWLLVFRAYAERRRLQNVVPELPLARGASAERMLRRYVRDPRTPPVCKRRAESFLHMLAIEHLLAHATLAETRRALASDEDRIKEAAIVRLGLLAKQQAVPEQLLVAFLDDDDALLRVAALGALVEAGTDDAALRARIAGLVVDTDEDPLVRNVALQAVERLDPERGRALRRELGDELLRTLLDARPGRALPAAAVRPR